MGYRRTFITVIMVVFLTTCTSPGNMLRLATVVPTIALASVATPQPAAASTGLLDPQAARTAPAVIISTVTASPNNVSYLPTSTALPPSPTPPFDLESWSSLPVIPTLGPRALAILRDGLAKGNNPRAFAKIGDCESRASWFLGDFDLGTGYYSLGSYAGELSPVIPYYAGSFKRISLAARPGFSAASLMAPIWADKKICQKDESPLACEYRIQRPIVAFIMLGSNDASNPKTFEGHMRKVIEYSISQGTLPVLGTKADNVEKDQFINKTIARLAYEYGLPLWNFWAAVQNLPDHGLQEDGVHLTFATNHFNDPAAMEHAWPVRNLGALEILRLVMDQTKR